MGRGYFLLTLIMLAGCVSPKALKHDYADYSEVYAQANDQQLLLNLARMANDAPLSFIQLGSFSSQYQFSGSIGFNPNYSENSSSGGFFSHGWGLGGNAGAGFTETPIFQFLPLTGSNFVQAVLNPISDRVYATFYDQGWQASWVLRILADSVEHQVVTETIVTNLVTNIVAGVTSVVAAPVAVSTTNFEFWVNNPYSPTYPQFLNFCMDLQNAQRCHALSVVNGVVCTNVVYCSADAKLTDVVAAVQAGLSVTCDPQATKRFQVTKTDTGVRFASSSPFVSGDDSVPQSIFNPDRESAAASLRRAVEFSQKYTGHEYTLKLRTFEAAMYSAAKEEDEFRNLAGEGAPYAGLSFGTTNKGPCAVLQRPGGAKVEITPIMTLTYRPGEIVPADPLAQVKYRGKTYMVADRGDSNQNRLVFTILSYLFAQTTVGTQNLPVQQLIQVP